MRGKKGITSKPEKLHQKKGEFGEAPFYVYMGGKHRKGRETSHPTIKDSKNRALNQ